MDRFVARANIDHYLSILNSDVLLSSERRAVIVKLLIAEEDRLGQDQEQLEFAETRVANGRERLNRVRQLRDVAASADRANAERLVATVEATQRLMEDFCHQLREKAGFR